MPAWRLRVNISTGQRARLTSRLGSVLPVQHSTSLLNIMLPKQHDPSGRGQPERLHGAPSLRMEEVVHGRHNAYTSAAAADHPCLFIHLPHPSASSGVSDRDHITVCTDGIVKQRTEHFSSSIHPSEEPVKLGPCRRS
jgi:hypothetical protein